MSPQDEHKNGHIPNGTGTGGLPQVSEKSVLNGNIHVDTQDGIVLTDPENGNEKPKKTKIKLRGSKTVCLYLAFFGVGLATNILGPTLVNMRVFLHTDTESIVSAFSGSIVGWIGGSVVAGAVYEKFNSELQLTLSCLVMAVTTGVAPWTGNLYAFIVLMTIQGLGAGFIDAAGQPYGLRLWEGSKKKDPVMQATQLFLSIGSCVAPLIISPFLVQVDEEHPSVHNATASPHNATLEVAIGGEALNASQGYSTDLLNNATEEFVIASEMPVGYAYVTFGAAILVVTVLFFAVYLLNGPTFMVKKNSKVQAKDEYHPDNLKFKFSIYGLLFLYFFLLMWISGLGHLLPALVTDGLGWEIHKGSIIASLFWGLLGVGRMVGIVLSTKMSPAKMLVMDTGLAVVAMGLMSLVTVAGDVIMWVSAGLLGIATASEFASGVLWASKYVKFSGAIAAVCITGMGTGGIAGVQIAGYLFDLKLHLYVIYVSLAATVLHFILFVLMHLFAETCYKKIKAVDDQKRLRDEEPAEVELKPLRLGESTDNHTEA